MALHTEIPFGAEGFVSPPSDQLPDQSLSPEGPIDLHWTTYVFPGATVQEYAARP